jgi:predicted flap endonuclease-1-like 5' DNA nuclease
LRFDIAFYLLGILCFILAAFIIPTWGITLIPTAILIVLLLFGIFCIASGYSARPKKYKTLLPLEAIEPETKEKRPSIPQLASTSELSKPLTELAEIKGMGPKRIAQLNALQITSAEDLAKLSAEDLAAKLGISSKITSKWVEQARNLLKESGA